MSASKESAGWRGKGQWARVNRAHRCPICGSDSWCSVGERMVKCMRNASGLAREDASGTYYLHALNPGDVIEHEAGPDAMRSEPRASLDVLDEAYRCVLASLTLSDAHRAGLEGRGLSRDEIRLRQYRTLPIEGRGAIGKAVVSRVGEGAARGVPGIRVATENDRTWWTFGGSAGLVVPVRDADGRVTALKVRADSESDGPRYTYISSASKGGAVALLSVHVPMLRDDVDCTEVRVTEGELKADIATVLSLPTISIPGVGAWRMAAPVLERLGAKVVRVALDADHRVKPEVGIALGMLVRDLAGAGFEVTVERWDEARGKGIDDVMIKHGAQAIRTSTGPNALTYADAIFARADEVRRRRDMREAS